MGSEAGSGQGGPPRDAAHLDDDAECLEDPVHCGDAQHQHKAHLTAEAESGRGDPAPQV